MMPSLNFRAELPSRSDNRGPALAIVSVVFTIVAFITTVLRLWVRSARHALGWDDYIIGAAMILTIIEAGLGTKAVTRGKGQHSVFLTKADIQFVNMYSWWAQHVLFAAMALVKIGVCLLVMRIRSSRKLKWFIWVVIGVLVASTVELSIVLLVQCKPISAYWKPKTGVCWKPEVRIYSVYVQAGCSVATDLICSLLPIAIIWDVQLPVRKKISICVLMAMGLVCTALSAVRVKSLRSKAKDIVYEYCVVATWAMAELCLGIIATNLGLSRAIYFYFIKGSSSSNFSAGQKGTGSYGTRSRSHSKYARSQEQALAGSETELRMESRARSEDSDVPLEPVIRKKTEIHVY